MTSSLLAGLNASQKKAVLHNEGPLLVLAGAGSGKTRVLTSRVARLVREKVCRPSNILAVTFTNKAAREMRERLTTLVSARATSAMTVSTFHSFGARVLREHGDVVGLRRSYTILDEHERMSSLRALVRNSSASNEKSQHAEIANRISLLKNASRDPEDLDDEDGIRTAKVYKAYEASLRKRQSVDFDDLLLLPLKIFQQHPDILKEYQKKYTYVCIDEYQDTNGVQMKLARLLAAPQNNIMVVGDDDQSIYAWRGADSANVLSFGRTFKGCTTVVLNKNYRSTRQIVDGAMAVVAKNKKRKVKEVKSAAGDGAPIEHYRGEDEVDEAQWVAASIKTTVAEKRGAFNDHALLFRTNAMMRRFEEELRHERVPYRVVGAMSFFDRKEVKDILAYMRFLANPDDELSMMRVMRVPDLGIDKQTVKSLEKLAARRGTSLYVAIEHYDAAGDITGRQAEKCASFRDWCRPLLAKVAKHQAASAVRAALDSRNYTDALEKASKDEENARDRMENVKEILHGLDTFERRHRGKLTLSDYIQDLTLKANDNDEEEKSSRGATLLTIHKAKGLEFNVVYLVGLDDAVFPSPRTIAEGNIEEERRLFYVGMTRAKKRLVLTWPHMKVFRNRDIPVTPCRFLKEIPEEFLEAPFGQREDSAKEEFLSDFYKEVQQKYGGKAAAAQEKKRPAHKAAAQPGKRRPLSLDVLGH